MSEIDLALSALKKNQGEFAFSALQTPAGRDAFEYGRVCGIHTGLQQGIQVIEQLIQDEQDREAQS